MPTGLETACEVEPPTVPGLDTSQPLLTVIVPVFNEVRTLNELLRRVRGAPYAKQIIIVNDGSTDGTDLICEDWKRLAGVIIVAHTTNRGKGAAIRTGLCHAVGTYTIIQDADLEYDPQDYFRMIEPLERGEAQVVFGSRYLHRPARSGARLFRMGVSVLNVLVKLLYGAKLTDEATCYKAMSTRLLRRLDLACERFEFCPEVTAKICKLGLTIHEVAISYHARSSVEGKKIRWSDGVEAIRTLWRWRKWAGETLSTANGSITAITS